MGLSVGAASLVRRTNEAHNLRFAGPRLYNAAAGNHCIMKHFISFQSLASCTSQLRGIRARGGLKVIYSLSAGLACEAAMAGIYSFYQWLKDALIFR
jgi:hypothetical protein